MSWSRSALLEASRAKQGSSLWREIFCSRSALLEVGRTKQGSSLWGEMFWSRSALLEVSRAKQGCHYGERCPDLDLHHGGK